MVKILEILAINAKWDRWRARLHG